MYARNNSINTPEASHSKPVILFNCNLSSMEFWLFLGVHDSHA